MKTIDVSISDADWLRENAHTINSEELFKTDKNNHKLDVGETRTLVGLVDFPEYNGEQVEITAFRSDGEYGRTYYIKGNINRYLNWVYEYRLQ
jgi:hypothetical protein